MSDLAIANGTMESEVASEPQAAEARDEYLRAIRASVAFLGVCVLLWLAAYWVSTTFYYLRSGDQVIFDAKANAIRHADLVDMSKPVRVLVIGNSKVLSGFIPSRFEAEVPGSSAYNFGQPASTVYADQLEGLFKRGQVPTYLLYALEWKDRPQTSLGFFHFTPSDRSIMDQLFPFRNLLRDSAVFLIRSRSNGGVRSFYRKAQEWESQMLQDHGYFFIIGESLFPDHRLPPSFRLASDNPHAVTYRPANIDTTEFQRIRALAMRYHIKVLVVPYYQRDGQSGSPGTNQGLVKALAPYPEFKVLGDDYLLLDDRYFSDTEHLNPDGAKIYTDDLAALLNHQLDLEK